MKRIAKYLSILALTGALGLPGSSPFPSIKDDQDRPYQPLEEISYQWVIGIEKLGSFQSIDFVSLYHQVASSVVTVLNFGSQDSLQSIGSGVIYRSGLVSARKVYFIITNFHVVNGNSKLRILTHDNVMKDALLVGSDSVQDIAVLMITSYAISDSDVATLVSTQVAQVPTPNPGDPVFAIGSPSSYYLKGTLTVGIVSNGSRNTSSESMNLYEQSHAIQIDLALNPGNSGGPLFNQYGQVIGINTYKISSVGEMTFEGLNFSLSMHDMLLGAERIRTSAQIDYSLGEFVITRRGTFFKPSYGAFEITSVKEIALRDRETLGIPSSIYQGVLLKGVGVSSAFAQANSPRYAIIRAIDGNPISDIVDLRKVLIRALTNQTLVVEYYAPEGSGYSTSLSSASIVARAS